MHWRTAARRDGRNVIYSGDFSVMSGLMDLLARGPCSEETPPTVALTSITRRRKLVLWNRRWCAACSDDRRSATRTSVGITAARASAQQGLYSVPKSFSEFERQSLPKSASERQSFCYLRVGDL